MTAAVSRSPRKPITNSAPLQARMLSTISESIPMQGSQPEINDHWIAGPLQNLSLFASVINRAVDHAQVGDCLSLRRDFAPNSSYDLVLEMRDNLFDPATEDAQCWE